VPCASPADSKEQCSKERVSVEEDGEEWKRQVGDVKNSRGKDRTRLRRERESKFVMRGSVDEQEESN
jgi:hypothetical protein